VTLSCQRSIFQGFIQQGGTGLSGIKIEAESTLVVATMYKRIRTLLEEVGSGE